MSAKSRLTRTKYLVSLSYERLTRRLEEILSDWVSLERLPDKEDRLSRVYRMSHAVSPSEVWDCGEIRVRRLERAPAALGRILNKEKVDKTTLTLWSQVDVVHSTSPVRAARDHQLIAVNELWRGLPPNTFVRPEKPRAHPADLFWRRPDIFGVPPVSEPRITLAESIQLAATEMGPEKKGEKPRSAGRPPLSEEEIARRRQLLATAMAKRDTDPLKPWKEIARELGIGERTLREYRRDPKYR